jgi:ATP-dependent Clp protease adaptor protein ClpS
MSLSINEGIDTLVSESENDLLNGYTLTLYNDDFNTFDHVIECLIKICKHNPEQATQCAFLVHFKGMCVVKEGSLYRLRSMCKSLQDMGLHACVENT